MTPSVASACVALLLCLCLQLVTPCAAHPFTPLGPYKGATRRAAGLSDQRDLVSRCSERRHNTTLDHYDWVWILNGSPTRQIRATDIFKDRCLCDLRPR